MRKLYLIIILYMTCLIVHGQRRVSVPFSSYYDEDASITLGINYSYINSRYLVGLAGDWNKTGIDYGGTNVNNRPNLRSITSAGSHGISVGIPLDVRITSRWYATFHPNFVFMNKTGITYTDQDPELAPIDRRMRHVDSHSAGTNFNSFEFPLRIKLRSDEKYFLRKENRYRGYITGGAKLTRWIGINDEYSQLKNSPIRTNAIIMMPDFFSWEAGVGVDLFFTYFRMSPEIRFSQSIGNVLDKRSSLNQDNQFMDKLDRSFIRNVYFSLIFQ